MRFKVRVQRELSETAILDIEADSEEDVQDVVYSGEYEKEDVQSIDCHNVEIIDIEAVDPLETISEVDFNEGGWIRLEGEGLPFSQSPEASDTEAVYEAMTSVVKERCQALFGVANSDEAYGRLDAFPAEREHMSGVRTWIEGEHLQNESLSDAEWHAFDEAVPGRLDAYVLENPQYSAYWKAKELYTTVREWWYAQPEVQAASVTNRNAKNQKTFVGRGLAKPGTQIEIATSREAEEEGGPRTIVVKRFLIGDVNTVGGVCDDCMGFGSSDAVVRYRVLLTHEEMTDDTIKRKEKE